MTSSAAPSLSSLLKQSSLEDHELVLKSAEATLAKDSNNLQAQHVKVVALLKLDRYQDALKVFENASAALKSQARLEWAYTLYKNGRLDEAEQIASEDQTNRGLKHVLAQTTYRAEGFEQSANIYDGLAKQRSMDEGSDLRINSSATDAQLGWVGKGHLIRKTKLDREDMEQFETAFNAACGYVSRGDLKQADFLLSRARALCEATDELSEVEKHSELLPIITQQLYVACRLGKTTEAQKLAEDLDVSAMSDDIMKNIAQVNISSASIDVENPYLVQRHVQATQPNPSSRDRPFVYQSAPLQRNRYAMDLQLGKTKGIAATTLATLSKEHDNKASPDLVTAGIFNAAAHAHNLTAKSALKHILPLLEKRPTDIGLLLVIIQLYVLTDNVATATTLLEAFLARLEASTNTADNNARYTPGLIAILVSLYTTQGRSSSIKSQLTKAATYWRNAPQNSQPPTTFLTAAGLALLDHSGPSDLELAQSLLENIHTTTPSNPAAIAGLAASATSTTSIDASVLSSLPSTSKLTSGLDAAALEASGVARTPTTTPSTSAGAKRGAPPADTTKAHKKHKKNKLPKDYDASKQPDPERWLPMRERSYWKPKKGKKGKGGGGGMTQGGLTQGGVVGSETENSRPQTPSQVVSAKGGVGGKGKKKGRK